jgi:predicted  nucleic acid-binding Zn-ribbon protein
MEEMLLQLVRNVGGLRAEFTALKQEVTEIKQEITDIRQEMAEFKQEFTEFKQEMTEFKHDMLAFKQQTESFQEAVTVRLDRIEAEQKAMKEELVRINQRLDFQLSRICKAEEEIHLLKLGKSS